MRGPGTINGERRTENAPQFEGGGDGEGEVAALVFAGEGGTDVEGLVVDVEGVVVEGEGGAILVVRCPLSVVR